MANGLEKFLSITASIITIVNALVIAPVYADEHLKQAFSKSSADMQSATRFMILLALECALAYTFAILINRTFKKMRMTSAILLNVLYAIGSSWLSIANLKYIFFAGLTIEQAGAYPVFYSYAGLFLIAMIFHICKHIEESECAGDFIDKLLEDKPSHLLIPIIFHVIMYYFMFMNFAFGTYSNHV